MSDTADRVKKIVVEHLGVEADKVTPEASFIDDLGADSLDIVELVMAFEEEERLRALDDEVVGAHCDEVDADAVVPAGVDRQLELSPDAVDRGDEERLGIASRFPVEEAAEAAKLGAGARPRRGTRERPDGFHQRISGVDRHSGVFVGQSHLTPCFETALRRASLAQCLLSMSGK